MLVQVAPLSVTAKRGPLALRFGFSLSVTTVSVAVRSNATITYLPRSTGAGRALPNTPFFMRCPRLRRRAPPDALHEGNAIQGLTDRVLAAGPTLAANPQATRRAG